MKGQKNPVELKLNETHQLVVYANDMNLLGDNIHTIKKNTEGLFGNNVEKIKCMLMSRDQNAVKNQGIKIAKQIFFGNVSQFIYLGTTVTNQSLIQEEIKRRLNSGNVCYHSVHSLLSFRLLSKNLRNRIYKTKILFVVLHGCETWSLVIREEHGVRVFENRVLRETSGPKREEVMGGWKRLHTEELRDLYFSPSIIRHIK
jgi:hypothetical protein